MIAFAIEILIGQCISFQTIINEVFPILFLIIYPLYYLAVIVASKKIRDSASDRKEYYERQFPDVNVLKK